MKIPIYQVDAFTDHIFGGNPAAVCPLQKWIEPSLMQKIAEENNLSETAFFVPKDDYFEIRWFTPKLEINLAGHPTLAASWVIFNELNYQKEEIIFQSHTSGKLRVTKKDNLLTLDFPSNKPGKVEIFNELTEALGREPKELYKARDYLAVFASQNDIISLDPNFNLLGKIDAHGFIVTAPGKESDFVSRFFAPYVGINEDPVTGSAHTQLIPFWAERLNKNELSAIQLSERIGKLQCEFHGERVKIAGTAKLFMKGEIII
jgi:PhzF family phenazine biosynthesis protein